MSKTFYLSRSWYFEGIREQLMETKTDIHPIDLKEGHNHFQSHTRKIFLLFLLIKVLVVRLFTIIGNSDSYKIV